MGTFRTSVWWNLIVAADPGLARFRMGARACLAAATAALVLTEAAKALHKPIPEALIGVMIAMISVVAVNDPTPRAQKLTILLLPFVASATVAGGVAAASYSTCLSDVLFILIVFLAVLVRPYGPRFLGLGFAVFLTYYFAVFFRPRFDQMPWTAAAIFAATGIAYVIRFWLVPDRPGRMLAQTLSAFRARLRLALFQLARIEGRAPFQRWSRYRLRKHLAILNQTALSLEDQAREDQAWRSAVLRVEMAVETLADVALQTDTREDLSLHRGELARLFDALRAMVRGRSAPATAIGVPIDFLAAPGLARMRAATGELIHDLHIINSDPPPQPDSSQAAAASTGPSGSATGGLRQAVQAATAGTGALLAGHLLSDARWYWAMIAAFVVFNRATTADETIARAWQRILGTALGVPTGLVIAEAAAGHTTIELPVLFVCIFGAYYFLRVSYSWTVVFFTTALALLYGLLGRYSPGLLVIRLEETMLGAAAGILAAFFVFPSRSAAKTEAEMAGVLREVAGLLEEIARQAAPGEEAERYERIRELDRSFQQLYSAAAPLTGSLPALGATGVKRRFGNISTVVYCARELMRALPPQPGPEVRRATAMLAANCRAAAYSLVTRRRARIEPVAPVIRNVYDARGPDSQAAPWLDRMDRALRNAAN